MHVNIKDKIDKYDQSNLKHIVDYHKNRIQAKNYLLESQQRLQRQLSDLGDQIVVDSVYSVANNKEEESHRDIISVISLSCYNPEDMISFVKEIKEDLG